MPRILVIFDEYAAINVQKDVAHAIQQSVMQLLNKGRAVGIHLVICTQNPSVDIVPGPSKANMAFRLAFPMPTKSASMTILGTGDAAELPGDIPGRAVAMVGSKLWQIQTPHVRDSDLQNAIDRAMEFQVGQRIILPEAGVIVGFTTDDLIALSVQMGGNLGVRVIFPMAKEMGVTVRQLGKMVEDIVDMKTVHYKDKTYKVVKVRKGHFLQEVK
jgi:DNA segregation ATPase FtsK/SpoIIIE-like protein